MTTDSVAKQAHVEGDGWSVGGMAKGAGMLAPQLATMLVVLTTDAGSRRPTSTRPCGPRPGSASTASTPTAACRPTTPSAAGQRRLRRHARHCPTSPQALTRVCRDLAMQLLADAEGADHDIAITVVNAATEDEAVEVGRGVARSNLFKSAVFGKDPNWGRVLAAIGTTRRRVRARRARRRHERRLGLPVLDPVGRPVDGGPVGPRGHRHHRPEGRATAGDRSGPTTSPPPTSTRTARTPHERRATASRSATSPRKAATLAAALPWLKRYHGKVVVVKYGGNAMTDDALSRAFAEDVVFLRFAGLQARRRPRRRPADLRDARPPGHRVGVPRRPAGDHARGDGRGPHGPGRPGAA